MTWIRTVRQRLTKPTLCAATFLTIEATFWVATSPVPAGAQTSFTATATSDTVRLTLTIPNFPLESDIVDLGAPSSQAQLDSLGSSTGFAAYPDPGDLGENLPGLAQSLVGVALPSYPFSVTSNYPSTPSSAVSQGIYNISATSGPDSSTATASSGVDGSVQVGLAKSTSVVSLNADGSVTAKGTSDNEGLTLGALRIGSIVSGATVTELPGGTPTRSVDMEMGTITVAGQKIGLTNKGLVVAGTTIPLPADSQLLAVLAKQNLTLTYLAETDLPDGVVSPGIELTTTQTLTNGQPATLTYVLGRSMAIVTNSAASVVGSTTPSNVVVPTGGSSGGGVINPSVSTDNGSVSGPSTTTSTESSHPESSDVIQTVRSVLFGRTPLGSVAGLYLLLILGGAMAFLGITILRLLGVKSR
jgi:hypothetical protein